MVVAVEIAIDEEVLVQVVVVAAVGSTTSMPAAAGAPVVEDAVK